MLLIQVSLSLFIVDSCSITIFTHNNIQKIKSLLLLTAIYINLKLEVNKNNISA
jgi:hypothetical protein